MRHGSAARYGSLPGTAILVASGIERRWPRPLLAQGVEAILPIEQASRQMRARGDSFRSQWLAVDEHVVGLVGDVDDRRGLRVAGAGRGDAADCVEAKHLDGVRQ
jgi:hypothetical protein